jgi:hypothetical protein
MDVVVEAEMADPLEAPVLESFAGVIDSVVKVMTSLAAVRKLGWRCRRRWSFPSLAASLSLIGLGLGCRWGD